MRRDDGDAYCDYNLINKYMAFHSYNRETVNLGTLFGALTVITSQQLYDIFGLNKNWQINDPLWIISEIL